MRNKEEIENSLMECLEYELYEDYGSEESNMNDGWIEALEWVLKKSDYSEDKTRKAFVDRRLSELKVKDENSGLTKG